MMFGQKLIKQPRQSDDCKIKIKRTDKGEEISFSGNCSKEQINMAKEMKKVESEKSTDFEED